jgi:hypothetical protein
MMTLRLFSPKTANVPADPGAKIGLDASTPGDQRRVGVCLGDCSRQTDAVAPTTPNNAGIRFITPPHRVLRGRSGPILVPCGSASGARRRVAHRVRLPAGAVDG